MTKDVGGGLNNDSDIFVIETNTINNQSINEEAVWKSEFNDFPSVREFVECANLTDSPSSLGNESHQKNT